MLYAKKEEKIQPAYVPKHNSQRRKQFPLLIISNVEGWHYLAVIRLSSSLLRGVTSFHNVIFIV